MLAETLRLEADALVTGHYVQKIINHGRHELHQAIDVDKDQSYFLFATTQSQLQNLYFPLGGQSKNETRKLAEKFALPVAAKPDSQDICFVPNGRYAEIVEKLRPEAFISGDIVDVSGQILGQHQGIAHYTVGQRKGIGIGGRSDNTDPLYVIKIDATHNQVIVGAREFLGVSKLCLRNCNWLIDKQDFPAKDLMVKFRSTSKGVPAKISFDDAELGCAEIIFDAPQSGVALGQAAVCYHKHRVLGGGWIAGTDSDDFRTARAHAQKLQSEKILAS